MNLHHLEWLIGEPVADPEAILYEILPYSPALADCILQQLCSLAEFDVAQAKGNPARAQQVREAFRLILDAAGAALAYNRIEIPEPRDRRELLRRELLSEIENFAYDPRRQKEMLHDIENQLYRVRRPSWRDQLRKLSSRHFADTVRDKSVRIVLRWALVETGQATHAGRRWLHHLRDHPRVLRQTISRALNSRFLQQVAGRPDRRLDDVLVVEGVIRAYRHLTGRCLGRSVTSETKSRDGGMPTGPGLWLATFCLKALHPGTDITDGRVVRAIRRARRRIDGGAVLAVIAKAPGVGPGMWARALSWTLPGGAPDEVRVMRTLERLAEYKLVTNRWALTDAGRAEAARLGEKLGHSTLNI